MRNLAKQIVLVAVMFLFVVVGSVGQAGAQPSGTIQVTFTNDTGQRVTFFLNGGLGLESRLNPGQTASYTMVVDQGVQPLVTIYQPSGARRPFTVENGGRYAFRFKDGVITNFYD